MIGYDIWGQKLEVGDIVAYPSSGDFYFAVVDKIAHWQRTGEIRYIRTRNILNRTKRAEGLELLKVSIEQMAGYKGRLGYRDRDFYIAQIIALSDKIRKEKG